MITVNPNRGVEVIAEIGVNHDGSLEKAIKLADAAIDAGAHVVKTQLSVPEKETSSFHAKEHLKMIKRLMLSREDVMNLAAYVEGRDAEFMCTPAEADSLDWLVDNKIIDRIKVASDAVTDLRFLARVAKKELPVILSTGMSSMEEVEDAFMALRRHLMKEDITLLHCTSLYPCPVEDVNLRAMLAMREDFGTEVGWSDHTRSLTLPSVAVGLGAVVIEKHLTLNVNDDGPDHAASLEPHQFKIMVENVKATVEALGDGIKRPRPGELETAKVVRKSICASRAIKKGVVFGTENIEVLRPGTGMAPSRARELWGEKATRNYAKGEMIDGA
jgi:N,N'-diacetyllegionaminate synthase